MSSIKKMFKSAKKAVEDVVEDVSDFVSDTAEDIGDFAEDTIDFIEENPLVAAAPLVLIPGVGQAIAAGMSTVGAATGLSSIGAGLGAVGGFAGSSVAGALGGGALATTVGGAVGTGVTHALGGALIGGAIGGGAALIQGEDPLKGALTGVQIGGLAGLGGGVAGSLGQAAGLLGTAGSLTSLGTAAGLSIPAATGTAAGLVGGLGAAGAVRLGGFSPAESIMAGLTYGAATGVNVAQDVGSFSRVTMTDTLRGFVTSPTALGTLGTSLLFGQPPPATGELPQFLPAPGETEEVAVETPAESAEIPTRRPSSIEAFGAGLGDAFRPTLVAGFKEEPTPTPRSVARSRTSFSSRTLGSPFAFAA